MNNIMNYPSLSLSKESIESAFGAEKNLILSDDLFQCTKCDYKTTKKNYMCNHTRGKHPKSKIKCPMCEFSHAFPSKIKQHHKIVHLGIKRLDYKYKCKINSCPDFGKNTCEDLEQHSLVFCNHCEYSARRNDDLKRHLRSVHEGIIYPCEQCSYVSKEKTNLKEHLRIVHEGIVYPCEQCSYVSKWRADLKIHVMSKHEGIVRFKCEFMNCKFTTNVRKSLRGHALTHKAVKCSYCEKKWNGFKELKEHMKQKQNDSLKGVDDQHHGLTSSNVALKNHTIPANMENLDEQINSMLEFGAHMLAFGHQTRRAVICKVCGKENNRRNIKNHIEAAHIAGALHPCTICGQISRTRTGLRKHISSKHNQ